MWFLPGAHCACGSSPTRANLGYVSHEPTMGYPHPVSTPNCLYSGPTFGATKFSTPFSVGITSYRLGVPPAAYSGTDFPGHTVGRVVSIGYRSPVGRVGCACLRVTVPVCPCNMWCGKPEMLDSAKARSIVAGVYHIGTRAVLNPDREPMSWSADVPQDSIGRTVQTISPR